MSNTNLSLIIERIKEGYYNQFQEPLMIIFQLLIEIDDDAVTSYQIEKELENIVSHLVRQKVYQFQEVLERIKAMDQNFLSHLSKYLPKSSDNPYIQHIINTVSSILEETELEIPNNLDYAVQMDLSDLFIFLYNERRFNREDEVKDVFLDAIVSDDVRMVQAFIHNQEVNLEGRNYFNDTLIHLAARNNAVEVLRYFVLELGLNVNVVNDFHYTPAFTAYYFRKLEALYFLIEQGTDLSIKNVDRLTLTELAIAQDEVEIVKNILAMRNTKNNGITLDAYLLALENQAFKVFDYLLSIRYPFKGKKEEVFLASCRSGNIGIIEDFIKQGLSVNICYKKRTPLLAAVYSENLDVTRYLLEHGANPNPPGYSPLLEAVMKGNIEMVQLLINNGANPHDQGKRTLTPLMAAIYHNHLDLVKYFIEYGVDVNQVGIKKLTPLAVAAEYGRLEICEYLLSKGAKRVPKTFNPLALAIQFGHLDIVDCLFQHGFCLDNKTLRLDQLNKLVSAEKIYGSKPLDTMLTSELVDQNQCQLGEYMVNTFKRQLRGLKIYLRILLVLLGLLIVITSLSYGEIKYYSTNVETTVATVIDMNKQKSAITYTYQLQEAMITSSSYVERDIFLGTQLGDEIIIIYKLNHVEKSITAKQMDTLRIDFYCMVILLLALILLEGVFAYIYFKQRRFIIRKLQTIDDLKLQSSNDL